MNESARDADTRLTDNVVEWRERAHDELGLAVAVAGWGAERGRPVPL